MLAKSWEVHSFSLDLCLHPCPCPHPLPDHPPWLLLPQDVQECMWPGSGSLSLPASCIITQLHLGSQLWEAGCWPHILHDPVQCPPGEWALKEGHRPMRHSRVVPKDKGALAEFI
jgi:hypothetical protein